MNPADVNYNHLHVFYIVAREGSLSAAAKRLDKGAPGLSEQVRRLESALGQELFTRTGGKLQLSDFGRQTYEWAASMFAISEQQLDRRRLTQSKVLRAAASPEVSSTRRAAFFAPLFRDPHILCRLRHSDHASLVRSLARGETELALLGEAPPDADDRGFAVDLIAEDHLVLVGAEGHRVHRGGKCLTYRQGTRLRAQVDAWIEDNGWVVETVGEVDDPDLMKEAVREREFIAWVPSVLAADEGIEAIQETDCTLRVYGVYRSREAPDRVTDAIRTLREGAGHAED